MEIEKNKAPSPTMKIPRILQVNYFHLPFSHFLHYYLQYLTLPSLSYAFSTDTIQ